MPDVRYRHRPRRLRTRRAGLFPGLLGHPIRACSAPDRAGGAALVTGRVCVWPRGMLRVVELNIDSLVRARWRKRRDEIVNWLDELDADVVCLQEICPDDRHPNTAGWVADHAAGD
jgi:Endonuclease/Exonuclease/phosphatase family